MIPAGFESKKYHNKFDDIDFDEDDEDLDEEEGFVFDFNPKKSQELNEENVEIQTETNDNLSDENQQDSIKYEINNNYYCEESDYALFDLKSAILKQNLNLVIEIMDKYNIEVNTKINSNWIPIMYAVSCGSYELTEYFIEKGGYVFFSEDSFNLLMCACGCRDPSASEINLAKIIDLLVSKGLDVNECDKYYQTPLMYACRAGNTKLIDCLAKYNVDLNAKDDNNWTSLAHASKNGNYKCVLKLLRMGADPLICSIDYLYPQDIAKNYGYYDIKELIENYLRAQKIESLKSQKNVVDFFENDNEEFNDESSFSLKTENKDEIQLFLNAIKLSYLNKTFKNENVTMQMLLNYGENDLKNIGVNDNYVRQLIVNEVRKFHHKNWLSSSLVPVKHDSKLSCNEALAIVSNISRHLDFINENIKYLIIQGLEENEEFFADQFLSAKLYSETKSTFWNCNTLIGTLEKLCSNIKKEIKEVEAEPIDLVKPKKPKRWFKDPIKLTTLATITISGIFMIKTKFFN